MDTFSQVGNGDVAAFDELYSRYKSDPESVDPTWRNFFQGFEFQHADYESGGAISSNMHKEFKVINLIEGYRSRGHLFTRTNPVRERRKYSPTLDLENFGLSEKDLDEKFQAGNEVGLGEATLREIIDHLNRSYCQSIGSEYYYIREPERMDWLRQRIEAVEKPKMTVDTKKQILHKLNQSTVFEQFIHKKYVGQKRFSIEGAESLIPALDALIEKGSELGVREFIMGMAHRGRLNVLANIFNKKYEEIFREFEGKEYEDALFDGDVKYHMGYSSEVTTDAGHPVRLTLSPNPSHLEAVDPVVEGISRALIDHDTQDEKQVLPILVHGDAAVAAQGVVYEVIQMETLDGYKTGGTIHIVINNQVGFTTNYKDGRSSTYCTDVAKTTLCPVFHVNGDDVEALVETMLLAIEYRQRYNKDVFIDLLCYRKYGHNEGDEPKFTQPNLYKTISKHPNPRQIYLSKLIEEKILSAEEAKEMEKTFDSMLQERLDEAKQADRAVVIPFMKNRWEHIRKATDEDFDQSPETAVPADRLKELAMKMTDLPEDKKYFRKVVKLMGDRRKMLEEDRLDWAMGELLGYASLLVEGHPVRISGQDVERGTFSHRHAVVLTEDTEEEYLPLANLQEDQGSFSIYNSHLSEFGVLGFEYGYAFTTPDGLTIWEAQFGDFNNGAQIIIDQFLSAAEDKWATMNGLVMFLPHGYEGQGSEHSSARLERYLQLCAENNFQVCNITNPANFFHMLRRQLKREIRKPLVVMTPKKLLRYPKAVSSIQDMATGGFKEVIDDPSIQEASSVNTIAFCSGKVYYDAIERRERTEEGQDIALVRVEQLYPMPKKQMQAIMDKYTNASKYLWLQEEPENMGAWSYMCTRFREANFDVVARRESASPAAGSSTVFQKRHDEMFDKLFSYSAVKA